jgi:adenylate kinase family enzyme
MQRVSVIGISGSGKSTIARRLARLLDCPHYELDAMYFLSGWEARDKGEFDAMVEKISAGERWVIDGSYADWTVEGLIWKRADTVVWPRLSRAATMRQLLGRSLRRIVTRQELWNGNRETLRTLLDPKDSIITDMWSRYRKYNRDFERHCRDPRFLGINFVVLRGRKEISRWLDKVAASARAR